MTGPVSMYARMGFGLLAVEPKDRGATMGICGLIKRDTLPDVDIGFAFLARFWGRGYAHEAAAAVLAQGTNVLRLTRVVALTTPGNVRSGRLLGKLGFQFERMIRLKPDQPESRLWVLTLRLKT